MLRARTVTVATALRPSTLAATWVRPTVRPRMTPACDTSATPGSRDDQKMRRPTSSSPPDCRGVATSAASSPSRTVTTVSDSAISATGAEFGSVEPLHDRAPPAASAATVTRWAATSATRRS
jgi:hypothetical protein